MLHFFFYKAHSDTSRLIYSLKYDNHPEIGETLGRIVAAEFGQDSFFDGITAVVPVPLARQRERERGYKSVDWYLNGPYRKECSTFLYRYPTPK